MLGEHEVDVPSTPAPAESESPITSMRRSGAGGGGSSAPSEPKLDRPVNSVAPMPASVFRQISSSWVPLANPLANESAACPDVVMVLGLPPSMTTVKRFL